MWNHVGHHSLLTRTVVTHHHHALLHFGVFTRTDSISRKLDPESSNLDLVIHPPETINTTVGQPASLISGSVHPPVAVQKWTGDKPRGS